MRVPAKVLCAADAVASLLRHPASNLWTSSPARQDVHAGNLLVLEDGRVAFIDFGIVGRFSPGTWSGVSRLADGVAEENFEVMAEVRTIQYIEKVC